MACQLEHANITVQDIDATRRFLTTAFPEFRVRGEGKSGSGLKWLHVGADSTYICLNQAEPGDGGRWANPGSAVGLNHLGYAVDDAEAIKERLLQAGYKEGFVAESHPYRKRVYVIDSDGIEWEFVQYLSDDPAERNDYSR